MPIEIDMLESEFLGPAFGRGLAEGRQEGRQEVTWPSSRA